jgi:hypothetical protein
VPTVEILSRILAIVCLANGVGMLVGRSALQQVFREMAEIRALSYVVGSVLIVLGSTLVVLCGSPVGGKAWLLAGFGCMNLAEGMFFLVAPMRVIARYCGTMERSAIYFGIAISYVVLAAVLLGT